MDKLHLIISGPPGSGKTTLLEALAACGQLTRPEVSRQLIREQQACGGRLLPWEDLAGFARECRRRMKEELAAATGPTPIWFDRGLPDIIAYLRHARLPIPLGLHEEARGYSGLVFMTSPWPEIYVQDPQRPQTFAEATALYLALLTAYSECGFRVVPLPQTTPERRRDFVLHQLATSFPWAA